MSYRRKVTVGLPLTALFCSVSFLTPSVMLNWTLIRVVTGWWSSLLKPCPKFRFLFTEEYCWGVVHYPPKNLNVKLLVWLTCFCLLEEWWHDHFFLLGLVHVCFLIVRRCSGMLCELPHLREACLRLMAVFHDFAEHLGCSGHTDWAWGSSLFPCKSRWLQKRSWQTVLSS